MIQLFWRKARVDWKCADAAGQMLVTTANTVYTGQEVLQGGFQLIDGDIRAQQGGKLIAAHTSNDTLLSQGLLQAGRGRPPGAHTGR